MHNYISNLHICIEFRYDMTDNLQYLLLVEKIRIVASDKIIWLIIIIRKGFNVSSSEKIVYKPRWRSPL
jgi:hypothetical protein